MTKRFLICVFAVLVVASLSFASGKGKGKGGSWTGWITDTHCSTNPKVDSTKHPGDCVNKCVKEMKAKYALYNPADKKVYVLDPQDKVAAHAGHHVTVKGTVEGDTIKVSSIEMAKGPKEASKGHKPKS